MKDFKEIVQSMTAKEIIMAMVQGLEMPYTRIEMKTFGYKDPYGVCFGCAATNTICKIMSEEIPQTKRILPRLEEIILRDGFSETKISSDKEFVKEFEEAINYLRGGGFRFYNIVAERSGFAKIQNPDNSYIHLPYLSDSYTIEDLEPYKLLAEAQES